MPQLARRDRGHEQRVELGLQHREAVVLPSTVNAEKRTAEVTWSTGARVKRSPFFDDDFYEELSLDPKHVRMDRLNNGAPLLDSHQRFELGNVLGVVEKAWLANGEGHARVRFSERAAVADIWKDVQSGVIRNISVGYRVHQFEDATKENTKDNLKLLRAVDWEPYELSAVPIGADASAQFRADGEGLKNPCLIVTREDQKMENTAVLSDAAAHRIRALTKRVGLDATYADELIGRADITEQQARAAITDRLAELEPPATRNIHVPAGDLGYDNPEFLRASIGEALACRHTNLKPSDAARPYMHKRLADIAREILERNGQRTTMMSTNTIVERALHTTSDFAALLGDTGQRVLRNAYENAPAGVRAVARANTARDFRPLTSIQLSEAPTLLKVNEHGEFKSGTMAESKETYRLETFGRIFGLTRQAIINDDLGAFTGMTEQLGRAASEFIAQQLVDLLAGNPTMDDGLALFHATHGNLAGSGGAISLTTLGAARLAMRTQKGLDKKTPIDATPRYLLVPAALETVAEQYLTQINATVAADANPFPGRLSLVVDPRLDTKSATRWYLFADQGVITVLEYAFLEDDAGPVVSTREGFTIDGVEMRVRLDLGAGLLDHCGAFLNPGA